MFIKYKSIFVYFCKSLPFPPSLTLLFSSFSFFFIYLSFLEDTVVTKIQG